MLYVFKLPFNKNGQSIDKYVVISYMDKDRECRHSQFLEYKEVFDMYCDNGFDLKILYDKCRDLPFVVYEGEPSRVVDTTDLVKMVIRGMSGVLEKEGTPEYTNTFDKVCELIYEKLRDNTSYEDMRRLTEASLEVFKHCKSKGYNKSLAFGPLDVCSDFAVDTIEYINKVNKNAVKVFTEISDEQNVTKFMEECTDEVFIQLPKWTLLRNSDIDYHSLLPDYSEICKPYSNPAWFTPQYNKNSRWVNYKDIIKGTDENSYNPIMPNEELYYHAMLDWAKFNMRQYFENEQYDILDPQSKEYFEVLLGFLYSAGWGHNPLVPEYRPDDSDEDSDAGNYLFSINSAQVNGIFILLDFMEKAARDLGWEVYPQAIVRLARWGGRKCTSLIFENYDKAFNLNKSIIEKNNGDVRDYVFSSRDLTKLIYLDDFKDTTYLKEQGCYDCDIIVGVVAEERYVHPKKGTYYVTPVYYPLIDLINLVKDDEINTIKYDGKFKLNLGGVIDQPFSILPRVGLSTIISAHSNTNSKKDPFYRSTGLENICFESPGLKRENINQLKVISHLAANPDISFDGYLCTNKAEIAMLIQRDSLNMSATNIVTYSIFNYVFPVYAKAAALINKQGKTLLNLVEAVNQVMEEMSIKDAGDFYTIGVDKIAEPEKENAEEMSLFNTSSKEEVGGIVEFNKNDIIESIPDVNGVWYKLIKQTKDKETVFCAYAFYSSNKVLYVTGSAPDSVEIKNMSAVQVVRMLCQYFIAKMCGNNVRASVKFTDENSMKIFVNRI